MKRNSWHYSLAKIANNDQNIYDGEMSICQYSRKVFWGGVLVAFLVTMLINILVFVGTALYEILGAIVGFSALGPASYVLLGLFAFIGVCSVGYFLNKRWKAKSRELLKAENTSYVSKAYKSYKDKICFTVEFEEDK